MKSEYHHGSEHMWTVLRRRTPGKPNKLAEAGPSSSPPRLRCELQKSNAKPTRSLSYNSHPFERRKEEVTSSYRSQLNMNHFNITTAGFQTNTISASMKNRGSKRMKPRTGHLRLTPSKRWSLTSKSRSWTPFLQSCLETSHKKIDLVLEVGTSAFDPLKNRG